MINQIHNLYKKYRQIIVYGLCSVFTCILETVIGYIAKNTFGVELVLANSIAIAVGAVIHYLLVSYKAFQKKVDFWNLFVYIFTFILGFFLQNIVMKFSYEYIVSGLSEIYRYTGSKILSVALPFFLVYFVRKYLYSIKIGQNNSRKGE